MEFLNNAACLTCDQKFVWKTCATYMYSTYIYKKEQRIDFVYEVHNVHLHARTPYMYMHQ